MRGRQRIVGYNTLVSAIFTFGLEGWKEDKLRGCGLVALRVTDLPKDEIPSADPLIVAVHLPPAEVGEMAIKHFILWPASDFFRLYPWSSDYCNNWCLTKAPNSP
ncbi:MAG: hypothetical protein ACI82I_000944 [Gammaproteobacteria bacterium]|jgi:hypothetical protein